MPESDVPTPTEMWDFLVGLSETTQKAFVRIESRMESGFAAMQSQFALMQVTMLNVERRVVRIDDRLSAIEGGTKVPPPHQG